MDSAKSYTVTSVSNVYCFVIEQRKVVAEEMLKI